MEKRVRLRVPHGSGTHRKYIYPSLARDPISPLVPCLGVGRPVIV